MVKKSPRFPHLPMEVIIELIDTVLARRSMPGTWKCSLIFSYLSLLLLFLKTDSSSHLLLDYCNRITNWEFKEQREEKHK